MFNVYESIKDKFPHDYIVEDFAELAAVIAERESPLLKEIRSIDRIRNKQEYYNHKINFHPCISVHAIFQDYLKKENFIKSSGYLYYDYDDFKGDIELFKKEFIKAYGNIICLLTISTGGKGLGFFVKLNNPELITADNFTSIHKQVKEKYFPKLKIDIDKHAGGITRQWIIPHDKNIYYNENASLVSFDIKEINIGRFEPIFVLAEETIKQNMGSNLAFHKQGISFNSTKRVKDIWDTINWQTVVEVEHPVVDIKPIDFCKNHWARIIEDGKKHSVFFANANILKKNNPDISFDDFATVMSYINSKFTGKQPMLPESLYGVAKYVYESPQALVETHVQFIHFNKKCGLTGNEKRLFALQINAKLKKIRSFVLIDKGIKEVQPTLGKYKLTTIKIHTYLKSKGYKISVDTIRKYFKEVRKRGIAVMAQEIIDDLMAESEYLKDQRRIIFEGIYSDDILNYNFEEGGELPESIQTPTVKENKIIHMVSSPYTKPYIEQIKPPDTDIFSDEALGIKSLAQMKREKGFFDSYDEIYMKYWGIRKEAMKKKKEEIAEAQPIYKLRAV